MTTLRISLHQFTRTTFAVALFAPAFFVPAFFALATAVGRADEPGDLRKISLAEGKVSMVAPEGWAKKTPAFRIIQYEFSAPAVEGDESPVRVTIMRAAGTLEQNIDRWMKQFTQPDGTATRDRATVKKQEIAGQAVHLVDISGTYSEMSAGPFVKRPAVQREKYRMLGAIIVHPEYGQFFVKLYGPEKTVAANEKPFREMLAGLRVN